MLLRIVCCVSVCMLALRSNCKSKGDNWAFSQFPLAHAACCMLVIHVYCTVLIEGSHTHHILLSR